MALTALGFGPRTGYWQAAWDYLESRVVLSGSGCASPHAAGDRLFFWLDWIFLGQPSANINVAVSSAYTPVYVPVASLNVGANGYYGQNGKLFTREATGDAADYPTVTCTATSSGTAGASEWVKKQNQFGASCVMFGYTGGKLTYVRSGRLSVPTANIGNTDPAATAGAVTDKSLILSVASNLGFGAPTLGAPYLAAANGFGIDNSFAKNTAPAPGVPVHTPCRLRMTNTFPSAITPTMPGPAIIDGVTPAVGDRILVTDVSPSMYRGIYTWNGAGVTMTRTSDANTVQKLRTLMVDVTSGTPSNVGRWTQNQHVTSLTVTTDSLIAFSKINYVPDNAHASLYLPTATPAVALPSWHVQQGNSVSEAHAGWSLWKVVDETQLRRGKRLWAMSAADWT